MKTAKAISREGAPAPRRRRAINWLAPAYTKNEKESETGKDIDSVDKTPKVIAMGKYPMRTGKPAPACP